MLITRIILNRALQRKAFDILLEISTTTQIQNKRFDLPAFFVKGFALMLLYVAGEFIFFPAKYRAIAKAFCRLLKGDADGALANFRSAARFGFFSLDIVLAGVARSELYCRRYESSRALLELAYTLEPNNADVAYNLALLNLVFGDESAAKNLILHAIALDQRYAMAHQNLAARYDRNFWTPRSLDLLGDPELHLYDAYHHIGQLLVGATNVEKGIRMFGAAMAQQVQLAKKYHVPRYLIEALHEFQGYDPLKPLRILSYEWVTQIGHIGMIDALLKMQRLGMRPDCNWVLLAPRDKISNPDFLNCWKPYLTIVHDPELIDGLFPYQRICGEQFNCYMNEQGQAVDWSDAAAQAFIEWDRQGRDSLLSISAPMKVFERGRLEALGLPPGAWFVALHVRSSGFYGEGWGHIQKHRNAPLKSYLPAIRRIHEAGGWVVRMGDSSMPRLRNMPMTIDLAHSPYRSKMLDVYLWSHARFFLGTTSGPTNAVIAFHTPTLLVNCVSNYAQSWNSRVMFVLKPFWSKGAGRYLKLREIFTPEFRAKMFNIRALAGEGIYPRANTAKDILAATEEIMEYLDGDGLPQMQDPGPLKDAGCDLWLWGNAHPSKRFFEMHRQRLVD